MGSASMADAQSVLGDGRTVCGEDRVREFTQALAGRVDVRFSLTGLGTSRTPSTGSPSKASGLVGVVARLRSGKGRDKPHWGWILTRSIDPSTFFSFWRLRLR